MKIEKIIEEKNAIFIDFFDTMVHRTCHPEKIKQIWSKKLQNILDYGINSENIYLMRLQIERHLQQKNIEKEYRYSEFTLEIYNRLRYKMNIDFDYNTFNQMLLDIELKLESAALVIDLETERLIDLAKRAGKKIYIISDFYLGKEYLKKLLNNFSIKNKIDDIFVSCDYYKSKRSGTLYKEVMGILELTPDECFMIGDNKYSDYIMAKEVGIDAYHKKFYNQYRIENKNTIIGKLRKEISDKNDFSGHVSVLYLFIERLYVELKRNNQNNVYFLAREGEYLKKLFDCYLTLNNDSDIKSYYIYASRVSTFSASLKPIEEEKFEKLFRQFSNMSTRDFLKNLTFSELEINDIEESAEWNIDEIICDYGKSIQFELLKRNECFRKLYRRNMESQKRYFKDYLECLDIRTGSEINIVDVGWKGTMQDNIYTFFDGKIKINGYYIGYNELGDIGKDSKKYGLVFSAIPFYSTNYSIWAIDAGFLEKVLYASHASTQRYECEENIVRPVLKSFDSEIGTYELVKPLQTRMLEKFEFIYKILEDSCFLFSDLKDFVLLEYLKSTCLLTSKKAKFHLYLEKNHYENFGIFKSANEIYGKTKHQYIIKACHEVMHIKKIFNPDKLYLVSNYLIRFNLGIFIPLYSKIVFRCTSRRIGKIWTY